MNRPTMIYPLIALALMVAIRPYVTAAPQLSDWAEPTNLGCQINSFADMQPYIAADRQTLFFTSNRPGGCGALDLYMTTRTRHGAPNNGE